MKPSEELAVLAQRMEQLLALLEPLGKSGDAAALDFADGVRRRLDDLRSIGAVGDPMRLIARLLDLVPNAVDADAIGFLIAQHAAIAALHRQIEVAGAVLAKPLIDAL